jgi:hypothetical protein
MVVAVMEMAEAGMGTAALVVLGGRVVVVAVRAEAENTSRNSSMLNTNSNVPMVR